MVTIPRQILSHFTRFSAVCIAAIILTVVLLHQANTRPAHASSDTVSALHTMKPLDRTTPNTIITQADGTEVAFNNVTGRPILVNFWASWCAPCVRELPDLVVLDRALAEQGMGVMLIGIDRKGHEFGESFLSKKGIDIASRLYDPSGDLPRALNLKVMPTSFLITADGRMIGKIEGPLHWASPQVIAAVQSALTP